MRSVLSNLDDVATFLGDLVALEGTICSYEFMTDLFMGTSDVDKPPSACFRVWESVQARTPAFLRPGTFDVVEPAPAIPARPGIHRPIRWLAASEEGGPAASTSARASENESSTLLQLDHVVDIALQGQNLQSCPEACELPRSQQDKLLISVGSAAPPVDGMQVYELLVPTSWATLWLPRGAGADAVAVDATAGWGVVLASYLQELTPKTWLRGPISAEQFAKNLGAFLALMCVEPTRVSASEQAELPSLGQRTSELIRRRAGEPGLSAAAVAAELSVGERTLHRALHTHGTSFAQALLTCRIDLAQRLLESAAFDKLSVGEIGRRAGFLDPSYFTRAFKNRMGMTPAKFRTSRGR